MGSEVVTRSSDLLLDLPKSIPCAKAVATENEPLADPALAAARKYCHLVSNAADQPSNANVKQATHWAGGAFSRNRNAAVSRRWQARQSVRRFVRSHSPPPSTTGTM
jgi:hypothetical protein